MATDTSSTNNGDCFIRSNAPTSNIDSDPMKVGWRTGPVTDHGLIKFTLPSIAGTISQVSLFLYMESNEDTQTQSIEVHQLTRDFTSSLATWNTYDGTNNWTSAGGDYSGTVIHATNSVATSSTQQWDLMGGSSTNPLTLSFGDTVRLLLKRATESGTTATYDYASSENATPANRPYLQITYTASSGSPTMLMMRI